MHTSGLRVAAQACRKSVSSGIEISDEAQKEGRYSPLLPQESERAFCYR